MINLSNYEDWFLLYADGELTVAEQEAVLKFVDQHPSLQEEFDLLTSIRFDPEENVQLEDKSTLSSAYFEEIESMYHFTPDLSIQCPDKQRLYKKTAAPVLSMFRYISIAAATVVTAGIIWWMNADTDIQPSIVQVVPMQQEPSGSISTAPILSLELPVLPEANESKSTYAVKNQAVQNRNVVESQVVGTEELTEEVQSVVSIEAVPVPELIDRPRSNFSQEVLVAAETRGMPTAAVVPVGPAINTSMIIDAEMNSEKQVPGRGLLRKISRTLLGEENEESDGKKYVQFAVFQIPVKQ
jgi:hypothetical protein